MAPDERQQFAQLLERHRGIVAKVAGTYATQAEDRADLGQEIVMQLWRAFPRYDGQRAFSTWMYRIALNVAISHLRGRRPDDVALDESLHDTLPDSADDSCDALAREQQVQLLHHFIQRQAPLDRALLLLYLEERSQRDIAEILGLSETNVATKIGRLKQRLRNEL